MRQSPVGGQDLGDPGRFDKLRFGKNTKKEKKNRKKEKRKQFL